MELPTGITGFYRGKSPKSQSDLALFQKYSYTAAHLTGSCIVSTELPVRYPMNYARITFEFFNRGAVNKTLAVLLNTTYPYIAFVRPAPGDYIATHFIDHQALADAYRSFELYTVLSAAQVQAPLKPSDYQNLHKGELHQLRYWQPQTIGEVIFNWWD